LNLQKYDFVVVHRPGKPTRQTRHRGELTMPEPPTRKPVMRLSQDSSPLPPPNSVRVEDQLRLTLPDDELAQSILAEPISHPWN
jgi:hypothetical protein